jgi:recombination protein RecR
MSNSPDLDSLVQQMAKLPGLGPRSARRAVLQLVKKKESALLPMISALQRVADTMATCEACGNIDTQNPCHICTDPRRDARTLCVVEDVADLWALERGGHWRGRYHVLGGKLSALDGVRPEDLSIEPLVRRVVQAKTASPPLEEVVLAVGATLEGQTTAHYVADQLADLGVILSTLAHGVPVGGELDYLDEGTLTLALRARRPIE